MPDHDREPAFLHTLRQDPGDGAAAPRCPSCRGTGVTLQDDCVSCGREVGVGQVPQTEDMTNSVKALRIKTEVDDAPQAVIIPAFVPERKPVIPVAAGGPRASNGRQRRSSISTLRPGVGTRKASLGQLQQQNAGDNYRSSVRIYHQYVVGQPSSSSLTRRAAARGSGRGGAGRGTTGAHPTYKGVRTRRGVKGYLVEIRPPKWKKTIWLGTYDTSLEAAGAYDAGVFYTKKSNTKYNFDISKGTFPPLPADLRLDRPDNMNAIKLFVQKQAKLAARRMGITDTMLKQAQTSETDSNLMNQPSSSSSCLTGSGSTNSVSASADLHTASTEVGVEIDSEFEQLPLDLDFLELDQCLQLHGENVAEEAASAMLDYTNYVSQQGDMDIQMLPEEDEEEEEV